MTESPVNIFWDSCVFIRYLTGIPSEGLSDIRQFLNDGKEGKVVIHYSGIALTEIRPSFLKDAGYGQFEEFLEDFEGAFSPIYPTPDILKRAGALRDLPYRHALKAPRTLGTPDAIHLMSCVYARDVLGLRDIIFHTFDDGKGKNWEGRCVSLLSFQDWIIGIEGNELIKEICSLPPVPPIHSEPMIIE